MGNICRSPAGEGIFRHLVERDGLSDTIAYDSAGTIGFHEGNPPDSRMRAAALKRGVELVSQARQIRQTDLDTFDLILTMDDENYVNVQAISQTDEHLKKVRRFCAYCTDHSETEVPDPYYGGARGFEHVLDLLEDGCEQVLKEAIEEIS